jgi:hypothetical protein
MRVKYPIIAELAATLNIDLVFLSKHGDPYGRLWQSRMGSTAAIRRRQIEVADSPDGLGFARDWVSAKLTQQIEFLDELWHRRPQGDALFQRPIGTLKDCLARVSALTGMHAGPAYRLVGAKDLGVDKLPPIDKIVMEGDLAWSYHTGGHMATPTEWTAFLEFADRHFKDVKKKK